MPPQVTRHISGLGQIVVIARSRNRPGTTGNYGIVVAENINRQQFLTINSETCNLYIVGVSKLRGLLVSGAAEHLTQLWATAEHIFGDIAMFTQLKARANFALSRPLPISEEAILRARWRVHDLFNEYTASQSTLHQRALREAVLITASVDAFFAARRIWRPVFEDITSEIRRLNSGFFDAVTAVLSVDSSLPTSGRVSLVRRMVMEAVGSSPAQLMNVSEAREQEQMFPEHEFAQFAAKRRATQIYELVTKL